MIVPLFNKKSNNKKITSQVDYDYCLNIFLQSFLSLVYCPHCHNCSWAVHGSYSRHLDGCSINVTRVRCTECNHTHAILFRNMIPYSSLSFDEILSILHCRDKATSSFYYYLLNKYHNVKKIYRDFVCINFRSTSSIFSRLT